MQEFGILMQSATKQCTSYLPSRFIGIAATRCRGCRRSASAVASPAMPALVRPRPANQTLHKFRRLQAAPADRRVGDHVRRLPNGRWDRLSPGFSTRRSASPVQRCAQERAVAGSVLAYDAQHERNASRVASLCLADVVVARWRCSCPRHNAIIPAAPGACAHAHDTLAPARRN